jgi:hypothetical protein
MNDLFLSERQKLNKQDRIKKYFGENFRIRQMTRATVNEIISIDRLTLWFDKRSTQV